MPKFSDKKKILNGVKYHHGTKKFPSLESEIIMNADCYKFLTLSNIKACINSLVQNREMDFKEAAGFMRFKFKEKKEVLSFDYCKKDLKDKMQAVSKFLSKI